jgi:hypothetical protein
LSVSAPDNAAPTSPSESTIAYTSASVSLFGTVDLQIDDRDRATAASAGVAPSTCETTRMQATPNPAKTRIRPLHIDMGPALSGADLQNARIGTAPGRHHTNSGQAGPAVSEKLANFPTVAPNDP